VAVLAAALPGPAFLVADAAGLAGAARAQLVHRTLAVDRAQIFERTAATTGDADERDEDAHRR
jgi:hypothetical protein